LPQKNGQLSTVNGLTEQGEVGLQEGALDVQEEEVIVTGVGQRESEDVREKDPDKEMAAKSAVVEDLAKDGQEETPETLEQIPTSDSSNLEEDGAQPAEPQANDVGFKKVFKFVGFKFTVKKDKTEKSDTVQLLTVKKDEDEGTEGSIGAGDHPEPGVESGEPAARGEGEPQPCAAGPGDTPKPERGHADTPVQAESGPVTEHVKEEEGEEKREQREPAKSGDSPSSPVPNDTASPFKKFFTQGWAGWRKKTSFRKPKEDELEASEEKKKEPEPGKGDAEERGKSEGSAAERAAPAEPEQEPGRAEERAEQARLSADYEKVELLPEEEEDGAGGPGERCAPLASEVFDEKIEVQQEVVAEVHVSTGEEEEEEEQEKPEEPRAGVGATVMDPAGDHAQPTDPGADDKELPKHPEGLVSEVDMLSSQERVKVQGSPLKKLFSSSGLKKLSAKKQKGKRGGGAGGDEEPGEHPPDSPEEPKGESSASSPEEPEEITCLEKGIGEGAPEGDMEEGATSDGEKKREGITPWASFKKMVTPKKRVRRPSESDKEEELDKVKSATLSSTESAASDTQEEGKGAGEEQKPEEAKRRVDTSVSWEALICVGSSKKRARKASSSDDEGGPRTAGEGQGHRGGEDKEAGAEAIPACSPEQDHGQGSSSPEPAGSPSEGEGVSTWESFKRLVTPRKKSKTKLEEKTEDPGGDHLAGDAEPGREESWVSIKKLIPGRRKKRSDGKQEPATVEDTGPPEATNEEDSEVPAVVPLSEYDAVEREKLEARESAEPTVPVYVSEELSKTLVHTVSVAVIDGARAVTGVEERSPSWISTSVTQPLEPAEDEATPSTEGVTERDVLIVEEAPAVTHEDTAAVSEVELTSEAMTAAETSEALGAEEVTEASGADMVSAVSQLTDSRDTTEEATPVQEVEGGMPDVEEQDGPDAAVPAVATQKAGPKVLERVEETEEYSEALGPEKQSADDVAQKVPGQETGAEHATQGSVLVPTTEVPEATAIKSQHQAMPPDSSETLTDSETNGSTPVADLEDGALESHDDMTVATGPPSQVTESVAAPAQKEGPPAPPAGQSQKEDEPPRTDVLEHTEQESPVEAVAPEGCKTGAVQEAGQFANGELQGELSIEGPAASARSEGTGSAEKMAKVVLDGEVSGGAECQKRDNVEPQSPGWEERGMGAGVEGEEKPEAKQASDEPGISQQLVQVVGLLEGSRPHPEQQPGACTEAQVQSSCIAEKVLETAKIAETGDTLPSAGSRLSTAEKSREADEDGAPQPRDPAATTGPESHTKSLSLTASATPEDAPPSDQDEERSTPQKPRSPEDEEQVGAQEGGASAAREGDLQAEHEILELVTESSKLVQNIIQTAVDQVARAEGRVPETTTPDLEMPPPLTQADHQGARRKEDSQHPPDSGRLTPPDTSKDDSGPSEHTVMVESSKERVKKPPLEPQEDAKEGAAVAAGPEHQSPALADADISGGPTKESSDTNGPKLAEDGDAQEALQGGKAPSKQDQDSQSELTES
uniref:A kinase anchor protein 12 n=1 Tax=Jaculus jaculus TaxID=51337 RepID=A0A8C5L7U3_JACJA